ncbi:glycosyltransferase family 25 protein [Ceratobasidium sp. AG-Ba]|nr:glycosyltransferase family 25 protein [Ceratobasidium sp. AG-Ba]
MAPIFKTEDGLPLACFIDPSCKGKAALLKNIRLNGGGISSQDTDADVVLIDAEAPASRQRARDMCKSSIVLFVEWVDACISAGRLLGPEHKWGSLRIDDPEIVDESLYNDEDPPEHNNPPAPRLSREPQDIKPIIPLSPELPTKRSPSQLPASTGTPSRTKSRTPHNFGIPQVASAPISGNSPITPLDSSVPSPSSSTSAVSRPSEPPRTPSYGQIPSDPTFAALFISAHEQWQRLKQGSGLAVSVAHASATKSVVDLQRGSSQDPLDVIATPERIYEPLARRPRPSHDPSGGSTEHAHKRRKLSNGMQRGIRSKVPSVLVPAPGAIVYSRSTDDLNKTMSAPLDGPSTSASPAPNVAEKHLFMDFGRPIPFLLQVDLPDRGGVVRLIKRHGGQIVSVIEEATYVIVSKTGSQYLEILAVAEAAHRVAVPIAWINECIKENRIVQVDDFALSMSDNDLGALEVSRETEPLTDGEIIAAARNPLPPVVPLSPPVLTSNHKHAFTVVDQNYLHRFYAWKLFQEPGTSNGAFLRELSQKNTSHTHTSWVNFFYQPSTNSERVRKLVKQFTSDS